MQKSTAFVATMLLTACGSKAREPASPPSTPVTANPTAPMANASGTIKAYDDPIELAHGESIALLPLIQKNAARSLFPKPTTGEKECWQGTALVGDAEKDFEVLVKKCGAPTGLVEYAKPVKGKLHHIHDKRDTYKLKLHGGMCYRYFAVADSGVKDLDILVMKPNGALVADDKTTQPVAIIEFDKSWCMDEDAEYDFHIEVDGEGAGHYIFGVFARPKEA